MLNQDDDGSCTFDCNIVDFQFEWDAYTYENARKKVDELTNLLTLNNIDALPYHASGHSSLA